jgi:hypothetical protein
LLLIEENDPPLLPPKALIYCRGFLMTMDDALPCACTFARAFLVTMYGNGLL